jgi:hypothetical protein
MSVNKADTAGIVSFDTSGMGRDRPCGPRSWLVRETENGFTVCGSQARQWRTIVAISMTLLSLRQRCFKHLFTCPRQSHVDPAVA